MPSMVTLKVIICIREMLIFQHKPHHRHLLQLSRHVPQFNCVSVIQSWLPQCNDRKKKLKEYKRQEVNPSKLIEKKIVINTIQSPYQSMSDHVLPISFLILNTHMNTIQLTQVPLSTSVGMLPSSFFFFLHTSSNFQYLC